MFTPPTVPGPVFQQGARNGPFRRILSGQRRTASRPPTLTAEPKRLIMDLQRVPRGDNIPNEINVIIEIPSHAEPVKYEMDKATGAMFVDRFMSTAMHYPCNYGYVPHTLSSDGDPVDVMVVTPYPLIPGSVIKCRPIGVLKMTDESGDDAKILALPIDKLFKGYRNVESFRDMPPHLLDQIAHFFEHYKDLDEGKWVRVDGWGGRDEAREEIMASVKMFEEAPEKPLF
jgi:inorganic pyrophosphatase